jgi:hypothetical protein
MVCFLVAIAAYPQFDWSIGETRIDAASRGPHCCFLSRASDGDSKPNLSGVVSESVRGG